FPVAQKLSQNIFANSMNHSQFTVPNRSRLIETGSEPHTPPPSESGKTGVRALAKTSEFPSPAPIPHDTRTGKMSLACLDAPDSRTSKLPRKSTVRPNPNTAPCIQRCTLSL